MNKKFYITTPIYYPSGNPHIGHCYTTVACDSIARYKRWQGYDVMFATGLDEHGQKIEESAKKAGKEPQQYVDEIAARFKELWSFMGISYDRFIRTTDDYHKKAVQSIYSKLFEKGYIYKNEYTGKYCVPDESFWTASQLTEDGKCPECGRDVIDAKEEAYFLKMAPFAQKVEELLTQTDFLQPSARVNEMVNNFIKPGIEDLCVSRSTFKWGIPLPFDEKHVAYVWIDALSNYITLLGYDNDAFADMSYWTGGGEIMHMTAKEIVRFHSIIWPAILMALDLPLPNRLYSHGWINFGGKKMGKSIGNVVDPFVLGKRFGVDAVRYQILRDMPFSGDLDFTNELMLSRINMDLANDFGNLVSRTVAMVIKYFDGTIPADRQQDTFDDDLITMATGLCDKVDPLINVPQLSQALAEIFAVIGRANKYIDETLPWDLAKDEANKPRLACVLFNLLETIRICSSFLAPFMPNAIPLVWEQIGVGETDVTYEKARAFNQNFTYTVKKGAIVFPRFDIEKEIAEMTAESAPPEVASAPPVGATTKQSVASESQVASGGSPSPIDINAFAAIDLRCALVLECEPVPKSDKLLKLQLDAGTDRRQVVSGIAEHYAPADLIGKKVVLVANLNPAVIRKVESHGMILAADSGDKIEVVFLEDSVPVGSKVR